MTGTMLRLAPENAVPSLRLFLFSQHLSQFVTHTAGLLAERIAARKAEGKAQKKLGKNVTEISRIRYEGALERTLS